MFVKALVNMVSLFCQGFCLTQVHLEELDKLIADVISTAKFSDHEMSV